MRALAIPTYRAYSKYCFDYPGPRVLANGIPKGGTHLLTTLLDAYPKIRFSGYTDTLTSFRTTPFVTAAYQDGDVDWQRLERALSRVPPGQYFVAHFPWAPGFQGLLDRLDFRHVVIIRDPRDVAVSDAAYISHYRRHRHHDRFAPLGQEEAITQVIQGFRGPDGMVELGSIGARVANYAAWREVPGVLTCRFESLVGPAGGGDAELQREAVEAVAAHIGRPLDGGDIRAVTGRVWSQRSHTFRAGRLGSWRHSFKPHHKDLFKEVAGKWLIELGYEEDYSW